MVDAETKLPYCEQEAEIEQLGRTGTQIIKPFVRMALQTHACSYLNTSQQNQLSAAIITVCLHPYSVNC